MFCRNCGKEVAQEAVVCISCGCQPTASTHYCHSCGAATSPDALVCLKCGAGIRGASSKKPWKVTAIGGMRLGSGICNILAGLCLCWLFVPVLLIPLGIIEIISGANLLKAQPNKPSSSAKTIPILEIVGIITCAGWIPLVVGILSLIWLGDADAKKYLENLAASPEAK